MKNIYIIRHCEAEGQHPEARLTTKGFEQALDLCKFFSHLKIDRIISSPYTRALESIKPLAQKVNVKIEIDDKLKERILSTHSLPDWLDKLKATFDDLEITYEGGESSKEAMQRVTEVVENNFSRPHKNTIIVTHGNLMSLLLKHFNQNVGFDDWKKLSNPDVYILTYKNKKITYERLWK